MTSNKSIIEALYSSYYRQLEFVFQFFDLDEDGVITETEFYHQCEMLNLSLAASGDA